MLEIKQVYICSVCETVHEDEYAAEECCPPEVWHMWQCPICEETHDTEQEAIECYNNCAGDEEAVEIEEGSYRKYPDYFWIRSLKIYVDEFCRLNHLTKGE